MSSSRRLAILCLTLLWAAPAVAGPQGPRRQPADVDGPAPPVAPAVITRDAKGSATVRAVRIDKPLKIDGRLDDEVYGVVPPAGDFIMQEPREGERATEQTDAWIFFDNDNLYIAARCWDDHPERWVVTELRRDNNNIIQNENLSVAFDTFHDRRNGFFFQTTPLGALRDQAFTDEGNPNSNWNTIWQVKSGRFDGGWTVEMAIPFKSLRYRGSGPQVWGINFRRIVKWKNEISFLTRVPLAYGRDGIFRPSTAGTLVGLETPAQSMNLELKPYAVSSLTTDHAAAAPFDNRFSRNAGFDFKYGLTRGLIADATVNTDFAQVEEDLQQINLTRFTLQFPEKRDFFLEGQGIFNFGATRGNGNDVPILFFSRRIGLSQGQSVPVVAGGRVTGTVGKYGIGALNIQTDDKPSAGALATNFSVVRLKRDILRRSNIGLIATRRTPAANQTGANAAFGADANLAFFKSLSINGYYARTDTPGAAGDQSSYRGRFDYAGDRYGLQLEHLLVGDKFSPDIGFMRRTDFRRSSVGARFSPRPKSSRLIRKLDWEAGYNYVTDSRRTRVESRQLAGTFEVDFENSDQWTLDYTHDFEYLPRNFQIAPGVTLPIGGYDYDTVRMTYQLGQQRAVSGQVSVATGTFYDGNKKEANFTSGRVALSPRVSIEPGLTMNWVDLPYGSFTNRLVTARGIFTPTPRMLISSLTQYNASDNTLSSSMRLRWEYVPGSELFFVYSDGRNTPDAPVPGLVNRSVAIKLTRLLRF
jgi:uncharacterized protein DUF5916/cellulose/xylan binding protein with CBM9 domain